MTSKNPQSLRDIIKFPASPISCSRLSSEVCAPQLCVAPCWSALHGLFQSADQDSVDSEAACDQHLSVHTPRSLPTAQQQQHSQPSQALQRKDQWEKVAADFYENWENGHKEKNAAGIESGCCCELWANHLKSNNTTTAGVMLVTVWCCKS